MLAIVVRGARAQSRRRVSKSSLPYASAGGPNYSFCLHWDLLGPVLVDTSVWSLALRRQAKGLNPAERAAVAELTNLIKEGRVRIIGLVRQELLSGLRAASRYENLRTVTAFFSG